MSVLMGVRARDVQEGDRLDMSSLTVESVTKGANGQTFLICRSEGGAPIVLERDPDERVGVRR